MALGKCLAVSLHGVLARVINVEANVGPGLPGIHVVGHADTAISESRDRIKTAAANSHLPWPKTKVIVSMSPASLPKSGSHFDLPMALAILAAHVEQHGADYARSVQSPNRVLEETLVLGELGLDGTVRAVPGIIPALLAAREEGISTLVIPPGNAAEATLVPDLNVLVAATLFDAFAWALGERDLPRAAECCSDQPAPAPAQERLDFCDIAGQHHAKWAAEVAAAGGHHLLMIGPPGSGKSMIASRLPSILPALSPDQMVETTAVHSLTGTPGEVVSHAPFIAPHSSVTRAALLGGGSGHPRPGAVSLAHNGVLFLDEVSEVSAPVLDGMRAPLEEGHVRLARAQQEIDYPARFQLIMAANPCRCAAEDPSQCTCNPHDRLHYLSNLSGPLRDRLDMVVTLSGQSATINAEGEESSAAIAERVAAARDRARARWAADGIPARVNGAVPSSYLRRHRPASESAMIMLSAYLAEGEISQRGIDRVLRVSWTLADLHGSSTPDLAEVGQALDLRSSQTVGRISA